MIQEINTSTPEVKTPEVKTQGEKKAPNIKIKLPWYAKFFGVRKTVKGGKYTPIQFQTAVLEYINEADTGYKKIKNMVKTKKIGAKTGSQKMADLVTDVASQYKKYLNAYFNSGLANIGNNRTSTNTRNKTNLSSLMSMHNKINKSVNSFMTQANAKHGNSIKTKLGVNSMTKQVGGAGPLAKSVGKTLMKNKKHKITIGLTDPAGIKWSNTYNGNFKNTIPNGGTVWYKPIGEGIPKKRTWSIQHQKWTNKNRIKDKENKLKKLKLTANSRTSIKNINNSVNQTISGEVSTLTGAGSGKQQKYKWNEKSSNWVKNGNATNSTKNEHVQPSPIIFNNNVNQKYIGTKDNRNTVKKRVNYNYATNMENGKVNVYINQTSTTPIGQLSKLKNAKGIFTIGLKKASTPPGQTQPAPPGQPAKPKRSLGLVSPVDKDLWVNTPTGVRQQLSASNTNFFKNLKQNANVYSSQNESVAMNGKGIKINNNTGKITVGTKKKN